MEKIEFFGFCNLYIKRRDQYAKTGEHFKYNPNTIDAACEQFESLALEDKVEVITFALDYDRGNLFLELNDKFFKNIPEASKLIMKMQKFNRLVNATKPHKKYEKAKDEERNHSHLLTCLEDGSFDEQILFAIGLLMADASEHIDYVFKHKDKKMFADFWQLLQITSIIIDKEQSFEVVDKIKAGWTGLKREEKLDELIKNLYL